MSQKSALAFPTSNEMASEYERKQTAPARKTKTVHGNQGHRHGVPLFCRSPEPRRIAGSRLNVSSPDSSGNAMIRQRASSIEMEATSGDTHSGKAKNSPSSPYIGPR